MGLYINHDSKGNPLKPLGKADALIADGAEEITTLSWSPDLVCVVENGTAFDAAGWAYSINEMRSFAETFGGRDNRRRRWLRYPHVDAALQNPGAYVSQRRNYPNG